jgi:ABC-2 type transport system ATP-binding protein
MTDALATAGLTKVYRRHVGKAATRSLDQLDLAVQEHEIYGFLGQNGAGKTTTIKIICGLLRPTSGEVSIFGENGGKPAARRCIGYLPENPYFYEYLTPRETLDFYGQLEGLDPAERREEWLKLSEMLDLRDIADQRVRGFSKGMRQRLGFAVALVGNPDLLVLDEPMSGLDPLGRRRIREIILHLRENEEKTIFFSSHVLGDVEQICDRVGIIVRGRMTTEGHIADLLERRVTSVEVVAAGMPQTVLNRLTRSAVSVRDSESGRHFTMEDEDAANELVRQVYASGGVLREFAPVSESLEEYFMRMQLEEPEEEAV